ncbi:MAG: penicillin-binding transpeptidase domain-containing protein, partial [bacterium]
YSKVGEDISVFNNQAILHAYEPGSIFKAVTMAAALDLDKVTPDTKYNDEGFVKVDRFTIRNSDGMANGWQTMTQVLEKSLNTGAIFAAKQIGNKEFLNYVQKFGFGNKVGIEMGGEALGDINSLKNLNDVYTFTASFGQGITVTPIQMINAFAAIANDGKLMKPYLVDQIIDCDGKSAKTLPQQVRQVISPRAAILLKAMLVSVVNKGYDKKAFVKGYNLAGKTGTAQVSDAGGGYSEDKFNHSFVGFGPVDDPQFVILIKINSPHDVRFASTSTAPIFGKLAEFILKYYEIPPTVASNQ